MNKGNNITKLLKNVEVEWKALGEVAEIYGGLTGKNKTDFKNGNMPYISYKNIFNNIAVNPNELETVQIADFENQHEVKYGDVLFTGSSETADEAGISSVVTTQFKEKVYLNSFSFGLRFNDDIELLPEFSKYLFRSNFLRYEISKTASGVTRFNISKLKFKKIQIPIPPLKIQNEIVRILDTFTVLTTELTTELTARKKQYTYYRDKLLTFEEDEVEWKALGDISEKIYSGGTPKTDIAEYWENGTIPWMSSGEVNLNTVYKTEKFISETGLRNSSAKFVPKNSVVIALAGQGKTRGKVARTRIDLTTNQSLASLTFDESKVNPDYIFHFLNTQYENLRQISSGNGARGGLNLQMISSYKVPIPPLKEQARIVEILDKFDALTNSITEGLPREIELRQKQYEYYRNLLLNFPKPEDV